MPNDFILARGQHYMGGTYGVLLHCGRPRFTTIENTIVRIPVGVYDLDPFHISPRFEDRCVAVLNVPGRTHILFHVLNWPSETEGCIGPGFGHLSPPARAGVARSLAATRELRRLVRDAPSDRRRLHVIDPPPDYFA